MKTENLLAAYGTLRPGEVNHRLLADVPGEWLDGWVHGFRGEEDGYPAFWYSAAGPRHAVKVFHSAELPKLWAHLDWFEGKNWPRGQELASRGGPGGAGGREDGAGESLPADRPAAKV